MLEGSQILALTGWCVLSLSLVTAPHNSRSVGSSGSLGGIEKSWSMVELDAVSNPRRDSMASRRFKTVCSDAFVHLIVSGRASEGGLSRAEEA
jgi:hypothetical protein